MDRLTLTLYAEQQPARAMKWWKNPDGRWNKNCWCAACSSTILDVDAFTTADADTYRDVDYCIRCHARLEFTDGFAHTHSDG